MINPREAAMGDQETRIAKALALHQPYEQDPGWFGAAEPFPGCKACATCGTPEEYAEPWPCATYLALTDPSSPQEV